VTLDCDVVIKGGMLIDGTGMPRRRADVAIRGGRICEIGRIESSSARKVVDASGCIVAPGFVDTHTHYDAQLFWDPYCTLSGWHGVTSVVIGNCGFGFAPAREADQEYLMRSLTRVEAIPYASIKASLPWTWESFPEWMRQLDEQPKGVNVVATVPLNPLLTYVLGRDAAKQRDATDDEREELRRLLREAMAAGASGWSAQHTEPGSGIDQQRDCDGTSFATDLMTMRTAIALAQVVGEFPRGFIQVAWFSAGGEPQSTTEVEDLAVAANSPVIWNSIQTRELDPTWHKGLIDWSISCFKRGIPMYPQVITRGGTFFFTFEDWNMFDDSPAWRDVTLGTPAERLAKFADPNRRRGLREHLPAYGIERVTILRTFTPEFERVNNTLLPDAARILEYDNLVDCLCDIVIADRLKTKLQIPEANEDPELQAELAHIPYGIWGISDGGAHTKFLTAGVYPTDSLVTFTRDRDLVSLEAAHWHLSGLPAYCTGLKDRGTLVEGNAADIIVYDHAELALEPEEVAYDLPGGEWRRIVRARGYSYTFVNGVMTFDHGEATGATPGRVHRRGAGERHDV
jgi:N-acyl-D-aspartate/D-glutamate deacylase